MKAHIEIDLSGPEFAKHPMPELCFQLRKLADKIALGDFPRARNFLPVAPLVLKGFSGDVIGKMKVEVEL